MKSRNKIASRIAQLKDAGMDNSQVSRKLNIPTPTVAAYVAHYTRQRQKRSVAPKALLRPLAPKERSEAQMTNAVLRDRIIALRGQGNDSKEIAAALNVPRSSVAAYFAHHTRGTYA